MNVDNLLVFYYECWQSFNILLWMLTILKCSSLSKCYFSNYSLKFMSCWTLLAAFKYRAARQKNKNYLASLVIRVKLRAELDHRKQQVVKYFHQTIERFSFSTNFQIFPAELISARKRRGNNFNGRASDNSHEGHFATLRRGEK